MSCLTCSKCVVEKIKEKLKLPEKSTTENVIEAWCSLYSELFSVVDIWENLKIPDEFVQEASLLLSTSNLLNYLQEISKNNKKLLHIICVMAYLGLLDVPENDNIWKLRQDDGTAVAHWAAKGGALRVPYDSRLWRIKNKEGYTPAHCAAINGKLNAPYDFKLWSIKNEWGDTPIHLAAQTGYLHVPYDSVLWRIKNDWKCTPAHYAAENGQLKAPYEFDIWRIKDEFDQTPAHYAAGYGYLKAPFESDLWRIRDESDQTPAHLAAERGYLKITTDNSDLWLLEDEIGNTPAHLAAGKGNLKVPYNSYLWRVQNIYGFTPAHCAAMNEKLNAPYMSDLWLIQDKAKQMPIKLSKKVYTILLHHSNDIVRECFEPESVNIEQTQNVWDILGYVRVAALLRSSIDIPGNFDYQSVINQTKPENDRLCDFQVIFKNITQRWLLEQVSKNHVMENLYCHAAAGALSYLFRKNKRATRKILLKKYYAYVDDSVYFLLVEYGLWTIIEKIAREKYGIPAENLITP